MTSSHIEYTNRPNRSVSRLQGRGHSELQLWLQGGGHKLQLWETDQSSISSIHKTKRLKSSVRRSASSSRSASSPERVNMCSECDGRTSQHRELIAIDAHLYNAGLEHCELRAHVALGFSDNLMHAQPLQVRRDRNDLMRQLLSHEASDDMCTLTSNSNNRILFFIYSKSRMDQNVYRKSIAARMCKIVCRWNWWQWWERLKKKDAGTRVQTL